MPNGLGEIEPIDLGQMYVDTIDMTGEFVTTGITIIQGSVQEQTLRCGKGMPKIVFPSVRWSKPPVMKASFPLLDTLKTDIAGILAGAKTQITQKVNAAKTDIDKIISDTSDAIKTKVDAIIGEDLKNVTGGLTVIGAGLDTLFNKPVYMTWVRLSIGDRKVKELDTEEYSGILRGGALKFKANAWIENEKRNSLWNSLLSWPIGISAIEALVSHDIMADRIDSIFHNLFGGGMSQIKIGMERVFTAFKNIMLQLPTVAKMIISEIGIAIVGETDSKGNVVRKGILSVIADTLSTIINTIVSALTAVAEKLAAYARQLINAITAQITNSANEVVGKLVEGLNTVSMRLSTSYNNAVSSFNSVVIEPIQCKIKEIEDRLSSLGVIKLPGFSIPQIDLPPWLPKIPIFPGGGFEPWTRGVMTTLTTLGTQISTLSARVALLERKVSV